MRTLPAAETTRDSSRLGSSPPRRTSRPSATTTGPRSRSRRPSSSSHLPLHTSLFTPRGVALAGREVHARRGEGAAVPAARRVPWTAPPHTSARVAGSAVPAAGQVHAHPCHLRREGRRDLRVGLARRAGPPRTSAHLDAPRHTSAHLGRASAHPRHTGGKQTPRNTSAESRQIWRSLGTHLCTSASPVAHRKAGCARR